MTTTEHLNKIVAKCKANLALAEKRTPGKYLLDEEPDSECTVGVQIGDSNYSIAYWPQNDAAFIAACAGAAEAGWRATIAAIEGLQELENNCRGWKNDNGCAGATLQYIHIQRAAILAAWPEELL